MIVNVLSLVLFLTITSATDLPCSTRQGLNGTCLPITDCSYITEGLKNPDFSDLTPCAFNGGVVGIFCCPSISSMTSSMSRSCRKIVQLKVKLAPKIAKFKKTTTVSVGELPHMAQIMFPEKGFVGSGALISEKFVITSAHVVYVRRSMPVVRLGKTTLDYEDGLAGLNVTVKQIIPHELYVPREIYYDVALLLLDTTGIEFKSHIWPACLYDLKMRINDQDLFTSGWIRKGKKTNLMVKTQLTSVANNQCQTFYGKNIYEVSIPFGISDNLFCANAKSHEDDSGSGDLVHVHSNDTFFIYAVASKIQSDAASQNPGIFIRIADVIDWIEDIIS